MLNAQIEGDYLIKLKVLCGFQMTNQESILKLQQSHLLVLCCKQKYFLQCQNKFQFAEINVLQLPSITMHTHPEMQCRFEHLPKISKPVGATNADY